MPVAYSVETEEGVKLTEGELGTPEYFTGAGEY